MADPQAGILPPQEPHALFLTLRVAEPRTNAATVGQVAAGVPALTRKVAALDAQARLTATVGFGPELWNRLSPGQRPKHLRPFPATTVGALSAPATGGDLFLHLESTRIDLAFDLALRLRRALGDRVQVLEEVHGFRYLDSRDLTGFIDGTENPTDPAERAEVALIGTEDRAFAGGSYVWAQRFVHDLARWETLELKDQEATIGRTKRDSRELSERRKPGSAHISRVVIEEDGEELEILRRSFPYGTTLEAGLFFLAYTRDLGILERMLSRMMGAAGDGVHDRLMEFTRAVSGATFFAPSLRTLRELA